MYEAGLRLRIGLQHIVYTEYFINHNERIFFSFFLQYTSTTAVPSTTTGTQQQCSASAQAGYIIDCAGKPVCLKIPPVLKNLSAHHVFFAAGRRNKMCGMRLFSSKKNVWAFSLFSGLHRGEISKFRKKFRHYHTYATIIHSSIIV